MPPFPSSLLLLPPSIAPLHGITQAIFCSPSPPFSLHLSLSAPSSLLRPDHRERKPRFTMRTDCRRYHIISFLLSPAFLPGSCSHSRPAFGERTRAAIAQQRDARCRISLRETSMPAFVRLSSNREGKEADARVAGLLSPSQPCDSLQVSLK